MNVSAASLAPDSSVRKATPSDITERTARSGAVVETIFCQDHGVRSVSVSGLSPYSSMVPWRHSGTPHNIDLEGVSLGEFNTSRAACFCSLISLSCSS